MGVSKIATELGKAYVQIIPSAKGISAAIKKEIEPEASVAGKSAGSKIATALKGAIAGAAIGQTIWSSLMEGAALQQSLGGVETLFKDNADRVIEYANEAYRTAGLSANDYMETVTGFSASLLQSLGGDTEKAAEAGNRAVIDMADNANKMGSSMESIQNAYQGFAKQNYTMLDNLKLGYGGTKSEMERLLADATKISGITYNLDNLADVYEAIHIIQNELGITGTTALEAEETFTGAFAAMKGAVKNVLGYLSLGEDIKPHLNALGKTTATFLFGNLIPMLGNIAKALPDAIIGIMQEAAPYIIEGGKNIFLQLGQGMSGELPNFIIKIEGSIKKATEDISNNLPGFLQVGVEIVRNISSGLIGSLPQLFASTAAIIANLVQFFMKNWPIIAEAGVGILFTLVQGILSALPEIVKGARVILLSFIESIDSNYGNFVISGVKIILALAIGILNTIPQIIVAAGQIILEFLKAIYGLGQSIIAAGAEILLNIVYGVGANANDLYNKGIELMSNLLAKVLDWRERFYNAGRNIVNSIADGIRSAIGSVVDAIGSVVQKIRDHLPFSPAKEGPLRDLNRLDFSIIAEGIYASKNPIVEAMRDVMQLTLETFDPLRNVRGRVAYQFSGGSYGFNDLGDSQQGLTVIQNIYAPTEDERAQQKEAERRLRDLLGK